MIRKTVRNLVWASLLVAATVFAAFGQDGPGTIAPAPNGVEFEPKYLNWRVLAVSHREDNNTLRAILGNDVAIEAARAGKTNPWPDGTVFAKVSWKRVPSGTFPGAFVPGDFLQVEFMHKDKAKFAGTVGWGFARWKGLELAPYGTNASFAQECVGCHTPVADRDFVFTVPARFPDASAK